MPVMSNPLPGCVRVRFIKSYYVSFGVTSIGWINRKYSSKRTIKSKCDTSWLSCEVYMYLLSLCTICKLSLSHRFKYSYLSPQLSWNWKVSSDTDSWTLSSRYVFSCVTCFRCIHFILISTEHALFLTCLPVSIYGT